MDDPRSAAAWVCKTLFFLGEWLGRVRSAWMAGRQRGPEIRRAGDGNDRPGWKHQICRWANSGAEFVILLEGGESSGSG